MRIECGWCAQVLHHVLGLSRCSIQMSKAGCTREHDKDYIKSEMAKVGGVTKLNSVVRQGLVQVTCI